MGIISIKDLFCLNLAVIDSMSYANQHNHVLSESEIQQKENVSYEHVENIHVVCTIIYLRRILTNVKSEKKIHQIEPIDNLRLSITHISRLPSGSINIRCVAVK